MAQKCRFSQGHTRNDSFLGIDIESAIDRRSRYGFAVRRRLGAARPYRFHRRCEGAEPRVPAPANISMTTWQIQTSWSPHSERSFER